VALVTGGSAGLGLAIARALAPGGLPRRAGQPVGYLTGAVLPVDGGWTAH
jgi:hypothetical protein